MNITTKLLQSLNACQEGIDLVATYEDKEVEVVIRRLVADDHWDWANWLLPRLMNYKGYVSYAVFATELVLPIWEGEYPDDQRPRQAIEAAKRCIDDPSEKNKNAAQWAARAARAAAWEAARAAAAAAQWAATAATGYTLDVASWARAAAAAARAATRAAEWAEASTDIKPQLIEKGFELLKKYPNG